MGRVEKVLVEGPNTRPGRSEEVILLDVACVVDVIVCIRK